MGRQLSTIQGSINDTIKKAVEDAIEGAKVEVTGGGGHFQIVVVSDVFEGKTLLQKQRLVLSSIKHLMAGDNAPVHAVDSVKTLLPSDV